MLPGPSSNSARVPFLCSSESFPIVPELHCHACLSALRHPLVSQLKHGLA
jgi:hypothetical protein